jgi:hypothetical protein
MMDRDPPRLLETSGSFATRELLRTALEETAPESIRQRVLSTIGALANAAGPGASALGSSVAPASGASVASRLGATFGSPLGAAFPSELGAPVASALPTPNAGSSDASRAAPDAAAVPVSTSSGVFEKSAATRVASAGLTLTAGSRALAAARGMGKARAQVRPEVRLHSPTAEVSARARARAQSSATAAPGLPYCGVAGAPVRLAADCVQGASVQAACASSVPGPRESGVPGPRASGEWPLPARRVARAWAPSASFQPPRAAIAPRATPDAPRTTLGPAPRSARVKAIVARRMAALQLAAAVLIGILVGKGVHFLITNAQASSLAATDAAAIDRAHIGAESIERSNLAAATIERANIAATTAGVTVERANIGVRPIGAVPATTPRNRPPAWLPNAHRARAHEPRAEASKTRESGGAALTANQPLDAASSAHPMRPAASRDEKQSRRASRAGAWPEPASSASERGSVASRARTSSRRASSGDESFEAASNAKEWRSVASGAPEPLALAASRADESLGTPSRSRASASRGRRASASHARARLPCAVPELRRGRENSTPVASPGSAREPVPTAAREPANDWLGEQLVILSRTERSLLAGNRDGALRSFDEYRARFPTGMLDFAMASLRERATPRFEALIFP